MRHTYLINGHTKIPKKKDIFHNIEHRVNSEQLDEFGIETSVVYELIDGVSGLPARTSKSYQDQWVYGVFRFYPNGAVNLFFLYCEEFAAGLNRTDEFTLNTLDPKYSGYRGVCYMENDELKYIMYGINGEGLRFGKLEGAFSFDNGELLRSRDSQTLYNTDRYVKREVLSEFLDFEADW